MVVTLCLELEENTHRTSVKVFGDRQDVTTLLKSRKLGNKNPRELGSVTLPTVVPGVSRCVSFHLQQDQRAVCTVAPSLCTLISSRMPGLSSLYAFWRLISLNLLLILIIYVDNKSKIHGHGKQSGGKSHCCCVVLGEVCGSLCREAWWEKALELPLIKQNYLQQFSEGKTPVGVCVLPAVRRSGGSSASEKTIHVFQKITVLSFLFHSRISFFFFQQIINLVNLREYLYSKFYLWQNKAVKSVELKLESHFHASVAVCSDLLRSLSQHKLYLKPLY